MITPTDKNLGTAIVERDWLIRGRHLLLSDQNCYCKVDYSEVKEASDRLADDIQDILSSFLDVSSTNMHQAHPQLAKFLASKLPTQCKDIHGRNPPFLNSM